MAGGQQPNVMVARAEAHSGPLGSNSASKTIKAEPSASWEDSTLLHQAPMTVMAFVFQSTWMRILPNIPQVEDSTDFFKSGAASVDVVR